MPSVTDNRKVDALLGNNADLGFLVGWIDQTWPTNDKRTKLIGKSQLQMTWTVSEIHKRHAFHEIMKLKITFGIVIFT
ncbi:MAG: hypothetical protein IPP22_04795 [Nitrosomonas sp.]|nr:hypothetical protein [Nitrosomonas sp.]